MYLALQHLFTVVHGKVTLWCISSHRRTGPNNLGGGGRDDLPESLCSNVKLEKNLGIRITYCTRYVYGNLNARLYPNSCSSLPIFENFSVLITLRNLFLPILPELFARIWSSPNLGGGSYPPAPYAYASSEAIAVFCSSELSLKKSQKWTVCWT